MNFDKHIGFIPKHIDLTEEFGIIVTGYFPYHVARVQTDISVPAIPRSMYTHLEMELRKHGICDNKIVVICDDAVGFGTESFALHLKDLYARIGGHEQVVPYNGGEFKIKK